AHPILVAYAIADTDFEFGLVELLRLLDIEPPGGDGPLLGRKPRLTCQCLAQDRQRGWRREMGRRLRKWPCCRCRPDPAGKIGPCRLKGADHLDHPILKKADLKFGAQNVLPVLSPGAVEKFRNLKDL